MHSALTGPRKAGPLTLAGKRARSEALDLEPHGSPVGYYGQFFMSFLRRPTAVGSLVPSSAALARAMVQGCDFSRCETVVELGPGTGAFTRLILNRIEPGTFFMALELDGGNVRVLRRRWPNAVVHQDSAEALPRYLRDHHRPKADLIVSGLPWANMLPDLQDRILHNVLDSLSNTGMFTTFAYAHALWMPTSVRFRRRLRRHFTHVEITRTVWSNLPPACVFRCRQKN
jgi:phosphatidylethanolamine/phosphatidyl-N-methylethanolamine N-methyltransferase